MKVNRKLIKQANKITAKYCTNRIYMSEIQKMYDELAEIGITTGLLSNGNRTCEWYYNNVEVENSLYVYSVYKPENSNNVEFTIYFS